MTHSLLPQNPNLARTIAPPIIAARRWLDGVTFGPDRPLIDVSQAAPALPPPAPLREAIAAAALHDPGAHLYGPVLGLPALRTALAARIGRHYGGTVGAENIAITQGCNQAFSAALATLAGPGDEVILPTPWYFNHQMWLEMSGVRTVALATGADLLPDPAAAEALITDRTRAIVLVTPNNPGGVEYPGALVADFHALATAHGIALVLDETYRDFDSRVGAPHPLFRAPDWGNTLIQLYSFSKAYRLTGHRVGALTASTPRIAAVEKVLDTVSICASQLGQRAALWGIEHLDDWLAAERAEILARRAAIAAGIASLPGWTLKGLGAYFAWVEPPFDEPAEALARRMVTEIGVLALPGSMFTPPGDPAGTRALRIAFANVDAGGIAALITRLATLRPPPG